MTTFDGGFEDKTVLITGAGRGLGRAHALLLGDLGARVVVNDSGGAPDGAGSEAGPAEQVAAEVRERGGEAVAHVGSVTDWGDAKAMIELATDTFGSLDAVINNAGTLRDRMLVNMTEDEFDTVVDVHLKGHFAVTKHAADYWRARSKEGGPVNAAIVNTSSGSGLRGNPGQTNYAAAKAAIATMSVVHARELERYGVRVNAIAPVARTRLTEQTPGLGDRIKEEGDGFDAWAPENVSPLVAWLAHPACRISGRVFSVYGGHVGLQSMWAEEQSFDKDGRWEIDELASALESIPAGPPEWKSSI